MSRPRALEYDEQEVDLSSGWERLKLRWWLPVGGLLVGALIGLVLALASGSVSRAETIIYLGQPFAPLGGGQIQSLATNPRTAEEIVRSSAVLRDVSRRTGIPVRKLRASISTKEIRDPQQLRGVTSLFEIAVKGDAPPGDIEQAADLLAQRVVRDVSSYVDEKVARLEEQEARAQAQLEAVEGRIQTAQEQQTRIINDQSIPLDQRLILILNLNSTITTADGRRTALQDDLYEAQQYLTLADHVEKSRIVEPAAAERTTARSSRTSLLVGALLGLLVGTVAALVAEPIMVRRRSLAT